MREDNQDRTECPQAFDMDEPMIWTVKRVSAPVSVTAEKPSKTGRTRWTLRTILARLNGH
ncbi:MAG: hypothetical protein ACLPIX_04055 [Rhodomicrobium sp.]